MCQDITKCCWELQSKGQGTFDWEALSALNSAVQSSFEVGMYGSEPAPVSEAEEALEHKCDEFRNIAHQAFLETLPASSPSEAMPLLQVGSSKLHVHSHTMAHVWVSAVCAVNFVRLWKLVWQALYDYCLEGLSVPVSLLYDVGGVFVSVTAIPPLLRLPPIALSGLSTRGLFARALRATPYCCSSRAALH